LKNRGSFAARIGKRMRHGVDSVRSISLVERCCRQTAIQQAGEIIGCGARRAQPQEILIKRQASVAAGPFALARLRHAQRACYFRRGFVASFSAISSLH